jgi:hypothetical protein
MVCQAIILGGLSLFLSAHAPPLVLQLISSTTSGQKEVDNFRFFFSEHCMAQFLAVSVQVWIKVSCPKSLE